MFGETIEFKMRTFRFTSGGTQSSDPQQQTIECDLHLEPSATIVQEQAADCTCYTQETCQRDPACEALFPFGSDSNGSEAIIRDLHDNHNYQIRITDDMVAIYKIQNGMMSFEQGRVLCDADSDAVGASGFLSMPVPRNDAENRIWFDIVSRRTTYLDIVEVLPVRNPRQWVYRDGSPATYLPWSRGEPNGPTYEHNVEFGWSGLNTWNDLGDNRRNWVVCTYSLPAGAENTCPWLNDLA